MELKNHTVEEFSRVLASDAPAPGGGSTAALSGALGAALVRMVAGLSAGKEKYKEHEALIERILIEAEALRTGLLDVIDRDTEAFNAVTAVFAMPKATDEDKAARKQAMQKALKGCCETPLAAMKLSLEALELCSEALGKTNENAASDLGVAALTLKAAVQGAHLNILINLGGIRDADFVSEYYQAGGEILVEALSLANSIYETVLADLAPQA